MAIVRSKELVAAVQVAQHEALSSVDGPKNMAILRLHNPQHPGYFAPTASYSTQIRNHGARIGATSSERVLMPGQLGQFKGEVQRVVEDPNSAGAMFLYPLDRDRGVHRERVEIVKEALRSRPSVDVDDILARGNRAPTARAMIAMGNVGIHRMIDPKTPPYYVGRQLDELSRLDLPQNMLNGMVMDAENIRIGGRGELTGAPLINMLAAQGIYVRPEHVATAENPHAMDNLPEHALIFTATPIAEQIKNHNIKDDSVIVDAGFGVVDGVTYGNADRLVADRPSVLWTPPREGVGPVSTSYLYEHMIESAGFDMEQMPTLGYVMLGGAVDYVDQ
jgi:hypothetical protein